MRSMKNMNVRARVLSFESKHNQIYSTSKVQVYISNDPVESATLFHAFLSGTMWDLNHVTDVLYLSVNGSLGLRAFVKLPSALSNSLLG